jgi:hypothetical protein
MNALQGTFGTTEYKLMLGEINSKLKLFNVKSDWFLFSSPKLIFTIMITLS